MSASQKEKNTSSCRGKKQIKKNDSGGESQCRHIQYIFWTQIGLVFSFKCTCFPVCAPMSFQMGSSFPPQRGVNAQVNRLFSIDIDVLRFPECKRHNQPADYFKWRTKGFINSRAGDSVSYPPPLFKTENANTHSPLPYVQRRRFEIRLKGQKENFPIYFLRLTCK